jgi:hypothetical protein
VISDDALRIIGTLVSAAARVQHDVAAIGAEREEPIGGMPNGEA